MSTPVTLNGTTYTFPDDFQNYGWVTKFPLMLLDFAAQVITDIAVITGFSTSASASATAAAGSATASAASATAAAASAATATMSSATQGTSTTSLTIGLGAATFTTQAGKGFQIGMNVAIADSTGNPNRMDGNLTAYNSGTGVTTVNVTNTTGSGTLASWNIFMEGPTGPQGAASAAIVTRRARNAAALL